MRYVSINCIPMLKLYTSWNTWNKDTNSPHHPFLIFYELKEASWYTSSRESVKNEIKIEKMQNILCFVIPFFRDKSR